MKTIESGSKLKDEEFEIKEARITFREPHDKSEKTLVSVTEISFACGTKTLPYRDKIKKEKIKNVLNWIERDGSYIAPYKRIDKGTYIDCQWQEIPTELVVHLEFLFHNAYEIHKSLYEIFNN